MTAFRVLLQSARLPVFRAGSASAVDLKAWLANQNYFLDQDISANSFSLRAADPDNVRQALGNDLNRLAGAAFESAAGIGVDRSLPRSLAWGSIRSYYSAFFAAHGIMRLFGTACVQLEREHADKVLAVARTFGRTGGLSTLDAGFFVAIVEPAFDRVTFSRLRESHRDTWATLLAVVSKLEAAIPTSAAISTHKVEASSLLSDLRSSLTRSGAVKGNWLSQVRNSINYQQSHGVWFPYTRAADPAVLDSASRTWRSKVTLQPALIATSDLEAFFHCSSGLVALLRELTTVAAEMNTPVSPVFLHGCLKLLHDAKAPRRRATSAA